MVHDSFIEPDISSLNKHRCASIISCLHHFPPFCGSNEADVDNQFLIHYAKVDSLLLRFKRFNINRRLLIYNNQHFTFERKNGKNID